MSKLAAPTHVRNMTFVGHSDQGGRPDGTQIMVQDGFAYIGHIFSKGFSVIDVRDPANPKPQAFVPAPPNTWTLHLQTAGDLLLVVHAQDMFAKPELADEKNYYKARTDGELDYYRTERNWSAGLAVYDISVPGTAKQIGFMPVEGNGLHRVWYTGGRWAYASAKLDGFTDYILITIDLADPTRPTLGGRFWLPGMNTSIGEKPSWPNEFGRYGLHHPIVDGDVAYCGWRDACLAVVDVRDRTNPKLITHKVWSPPFGGGTHNCLPLPNRELIVVVDEAVLDAKQDGEKPIWIFDNRVKSNPVSISTFPEPDDTDYVAVGGHFGPHNIHENRPGSLVSETLIFATFQNAGLRVYDISDKYHPKEVGAFVPAAPQQIVDPRPERPHVLHSADVFVDSNGLVYVTDFNAGLYIVQYDGAI